MYHIFPYFAYVSTLKMDAACSADVSVMIYHTMQVTFQMTVIIREIPALVGD
jgi:hypothetical protein